MLQRRRKKGRKREEGNLLSRLTPVLGQICHAGEAW